MLLIYNFYTFFIDVAICLHPTYVTAVCADFSLTLFLCSHLMFMIKICAHKIYVILSSFKLIMNKSLNNCKTWCYTCM